MWALALVSLAAVAGECGAASTSSDLSAQMDAAEAAYRDLDGVGFVAATDRMVLLEPCLGEVPPPAVIARLHRTHALVAYGAGEEPLAAAALAGSRAVDPTMTLPEDLVPGGPLRAAFDVSLGASSATTRLPPPKDGALWLDGAPSRVRPVERATLFQRVDADGRPVQTAWLPPAAPIPTYPQAPVLRNRLWGGAGAGAIVAAGLYAGALSASRQVDTWVPPPDTADEATSRAHLDALRRRANTFTVLSVSFGAVAVGGAAGALLVGAP